MCSFNNRVLFALLVTVSTTSQQLSCPGLLAFMRTTDNFVRQQFRLRVTSALKPAERMYNTPIRTLLRVRSMCRTIRRGVFRQLGRSLVYSKLNLKSYASQGSLSHVVHARLFCVNAFLECN